MRDMTGKRMSEVEFQRKPSTVWSHHEWVVEHRAPRILRPPYVGPHRDFMFIEAAILPLGSAEGRVDMILAFVDFIAGR
jgi:hypothetical protein